MRKTPLRRTKSLAPVSAKKRKRSGVVGKMGTVRLTGKALTGLRLECFERDGYQCQHELSREDVPEYGMVRIFRCWKKITWDTGHMAHIVGRGRGGSDTLDNVLAKCGECHLVREHNPKPCPKKERAA